MTTGILCRTSNGDEMCQIFAFSSCLETQRWCSVGRESILYTRLSQSHSLGLVTFHPWACKRRCGEGRRFCSSQLPTRGVRSQIRGESHWSFSFSVQSFGTTRCVEDVRDESTPESVQRRFRSAGVHGEGWTGPSGRTVSETHLDHLDIAA